MTLESIYRNDNCPFLATSMYKPSDSKDRALRYSGAKQERREDFVAPNPFLQQTDDLKKILHFILRIANLIGGILNQSLRVA